jgi:hypothetical protein
MTVDERPGWERRKEVQCCVVVIQVWYHDYWRDSLGDGIVYVGT